MSNFEAAPNQSPFSGPPPAGISFPWVRWFSRVSEVLSKLLAGSVAYTPTLTAFAGDYTTATISGRYKQSGKLVFVEIDLTITAVGTGTYPVVGLPVAAKDSQVQVLSGIELGLTGSMCSGQVGVSGDFSKFLLRKYDGSSGAADGASFMVSGVYEAA